MHSIFWLQTWFECNCIIKYLILKLCMHQNSTCVAFNYLITISIDELHSILWLQTQFECSCSINHLKSKYCTQNVINMLHSTIWLQFFTTISQFNILLANKTKCNNIANLCMSKRFIDSNFSLNCCNLFSFCATKSSLDVYNNVHLDLNTIFQMFHQSDCLYMKHV